MSNACVTCQGITKSFHDGTETLTILNGVDFSLASGEQVAIVGSSGSGKSTLLHILAGLEQPTQGDIYWRGEAIAGLSATALARRRLAQMGFVYQLHHLLPEFNALENVALPLLLSGVSVAQARQRARAMLEEVGLAHRIKHRMAQLSGGERQRTATARALVNGPACVLADEPTGNLDAAHAEQVYEVLLRVHRDQGTALLVATHDLSLAQRMDRVLTLEGGVLVPYSESVAS